MAVQKFSVQGMGGPVYGWAMGAYRPYWIREDGEKIKNPKFDKHSGFILDLKAKDPRDKPKSLRYCADLVLAQLAQMNIPPKVEILIVPSSTKGTWSIGLQVVAAYIAKNDKRLTYRPKALNRTRTIEKLANGGDRSLAVHLNSIEYVPHPFDPLPKIILDDVTTTGNSIAACITVMQQHHVSVHATPIVIGKTSHD